MWDIFIWSYMLVCRQLLYGIETNLLQNIYYGDNELTGVKNSVADFADQQDCQNLEKLADVDDGYSGSQSTSLGLQDSQDEALFKEYFDETPTLNDCSFHLVCAQASAYLENIDSLPFEHL